MKFNIEAKIETRTFKNGNFEVLVLKLSNKSEKLVFLTSAEMELVKSKYNLDIPFPELDLDK